MSKRFQTQLMERIIRVAEALHHANVITFASQFDNPEGKVEPGGMCSCCGAGPKITEYDWWLVFRAGICDSDGVYYSMLCDGPTGGGCLSAIRAENAKRRRTSRDHAVAIVAELLGDYRRSTWHNLRLPFGSRSHGK
ncbi:MAG: hypothetical protein JOZ63_07395 [Planctomycetaceae bacterium]|nr:hypothetical protein [Planctomycetaceae bacterium]